MKYEKEPATPRELSMSQLNRRSDMMDKYVVDPEHYGKAIKKVMSDKIWMELIEKSLAGIFRDYWPVFKSAKGLSLEREMVRWEGGNLFHFLYEHVLDEIRHAAWTQARKEEEDIPDKRR